MATTGVILLFRPSLCNHGSVAIVTPPRFAQVHIHMQNPNFVAVTVNSLNVSVMHDLTMVGTTMKTGLTLPLLSDTTVRVGHWDGSEGGAQGVEVRHGKRGTLRGWRCYKHPQFSECSCNSVHLQNIVDVPCTFDGKDAIHFM